MIKKLVKKKNKFLKLLDKEGVETRPIISGNFLNQPSIKLFKFNKRNEKFPEAQFVITGVLGPYSNAHGPNEFLHIPYAKKLTSCVGMIIQAFTQKR